MKLGTSHPFAKHPWIWGINEGFWPVYRGDYSLQVHKGHPEEDIFLFNISMQARII